GRYLAGLPLHGLEVVGEDFEGYGLALPDRENLARELSVVRDAGLAHQRRVRRAPRALLCKQRHRFEVCPISIDFYAPHHFVVLTCSAGCETSRCSSTICQPSVCGVTRSGFTV